MNRLTRIIYPLLICTGIFLCLEKPAMANTALMHYYTGGATPLFTAILTYGVSLGVVILIEAFILFRLSSLSWLHAILIAIVLNVISMIFGLMLGGTNVFELSGWAVVFGLCLLITILIWWGEASYKPILLTTVITIIIGWICSAVASSNDRLPFTTFMVWFTIYGPLLLNFGWTLLIEAIVSKILMSERDLIRGILWANICSYIFLMLIIPFFSPNIVERSPFMNRSSFESLIKDERIDDALELFHQLRASNAELMGLTENSVPPEDFDAKNERSMLRHMYLHGWRWWQPEIGILIIEDALGVATLNSGARGELEWYREYDRFMSATYRELVEGDQESLDGTVEEWEEWCEENPFPGKEIRGYEWGSPSEQIEFLEGLAEYEMKQAAADG